MDLVGKQPCFSFRNGEKIIDEAVTEMNVFISSISAWEVAVLVSRGRLKLTMNAGDWVAASEALPFLEFVPVNNSIALKSVRIAGFSAQ